MKKTSTPITTMMAGRATFHRVTRLIMLVICCSVSANSLANTVHSENNPGKYTYVADKRISGIVTDAKNEPLSGVSIQLKGSDAGTLTD